MNLHSRRSARKLRNCTAEGRRDLRVAIIHRQRHRPARSMEGQVRRVEWAAYLKVAPIERAFFLPPTEARMQALNAMELRMEIQALSGEERGFYRQFMADLERRTHCERCSQLWMSRSSVPSPALCARVCASTAAFWQCGSKWACWCRKRTLRPSMRLSCAPPRLHRAWRMCLQRLSCWRCLSGFRLPPPLRHIGARVKTTTTGCRIRPQWRCAECFVLGAPEMLACVALGRGAVVTHLRRFGLYVHAETLRDGSAELSAAEHAWLRERALLRSPVTVFSTTEDVFS